MITAIIIVWAIFIAFGACCYRAGRHDGRQQHELRVEIDEQRNAPSTCRVWRKGVLVFAGQDYSATTNR